MAHPAGQPLVLPGREEGLKGEEHHVTNGYVTGLSYTEHAPLLLMAQYSGVQTE